MTKEFSNKNSSKAFIISGAFTIIGFAFMFFNIYIGILIVLLAGTLFFFIRNFGNDTTVTCHDLGFTVKVESKRNGTTVREYLWGDVTETRYFEKETVEEHSSTTFYFQVYTEKEMAFSLNMTKNFDELISTFNQQTPHLPYVWEKSKGLFKTYQKQNRVSD